MITLSCQYYNLRSARWHSSQLPHLLGTPLIFVLQFRRFVFRRISRIIVRMENYPRSRMIAARRSPTLSCIANTFHAGTRRDATRQSTTTTTTTTSIADNCGSVESSELTEVSLLGQADAGVRGERRGVELGWLRVRASHGFSAPIRSAPLRACLVRDRLEILLSPLRTRVPSMCTRLYIFEYLSLVHVSPTDAYRPRGCEYYSK